MTFITDAVKMVAVAITNAAPPDVHPALYSAVMDASPTFSSEAKMVAQPPLRQQGSGLWVCADGRGPHGALAQDLPGQALLRVVLPSAGVVVMHA